MQGSRPTLLLLHNLPAEYYPPLCNLIDHFAEATDLDLVLVTAPTPAGMPPYEHPSCRIVRYRNPPQGRLSTVRKFARFTKAALKEIFRIGRRPAAILSFEPHSAPPLLLARWLVRRLPPVLIHHHELYRPEDFSPQGHRLTRWLWEAEGRWCLPLARWISQTNEERLGQLESLHPDLPRHRLHVLPNHPPARWGQVRNSAWEGPSKLLRLVYVGSLSLADTFIAEAAEWVAGKPGELEMDVFCQHAPDEVVEFLDRLGAANIRVVPSGVAYGKLPETLAAYHVGLILYKGTTLNFVLNRPNKLFEYLACGLDVWYPQEMLAMAAMKREEAFPKILPLDFRHLGDVRVEALSARGTGHEVEPDCFCETALTPLRQEIERLVHEER